MSQSIKILAIGHSYVVALNRSILRELAKDTDFEITIVAPKFFKGSLRTIEIEPEPVGSRLRLVSVDAHWTQKMHIFAYDHFQTKRIFSEGYDFIQIWEEPYIFSGFQLARLSKKLNIPFAFYTTQNLAKKYFFPFSKFEEKTFAWSDSWIACGKSVYEAMVKKGLDPKKGQVLGLAVDTHSFQAFNDFEKKEVRDQLGLKGPVIGYLGRLTEEKGLDLLMETLSQLKEYPWNLLVMGSGPYKSKLEAWAIDEGVRERMKIKFCTHDEVPKVLPVCDLLVAPSQTRAFWREQFGRMLVEAFAAGVPVVASDSGEIPNVVGEAGIIIGESNAKSWLDELRRFLTQPQSFNEYRQKGLQRAQEFSAEHLANLYKSYYKRVVKKT